MYCRHPLVELASPPWTGPARIIAITETNTGRRHHREGRVVAGESSSSPACTGHRWEEQLRVHVHDIEVGVQKEVEPYRCVFDSVASGSLRRDSGRMLRQVQVDAPLPFHSLLSIHL
jgi:hypothetical protein